MDAQKKKDKELYAEYIASADSAFNIKNYSFAKEKYKQAVALKPKEQYPAGRITECDKLIVSQQAEYKALIRKADSCFEKREFATAKTFYLQANTVKPTEQYASDQAKNCNYQIVAKKAMETRYTDAIRRGDSCFAAKSWACAKANYQAACTTKPEEQYPKDQIGACDRQIATAVSKERYDILLGDADRQYDAGNFARAKELYAEALTFNPGAKYAIDRIKLCEEKIAAPK
jgi:tetratricopeptide (TPR) repeat protein